MEPIHEAYRTHHLTTLDEAGCECNTITISVRLDCCQQQITATPHEVSLDGGEDWPFEGITGLMRGQIEAAVRRLYPDDKLSNLFYEPEFDEARAAACVEAAADQAYHRRAVL